MRCSTRMQRRPPGCWASPSPAVARDKAVPMAGVPHHAASAYINKLIKAGYKVAICEQIEDPKEAKGVVERDIVRVLTPGTLTEKNLLEERVNNYLVGISPRRDTVGLAWVELTLSS